MASDLKQRYIAFLRALNVGGRVVKMDRLRALFVELGFAPVHSYIQSGNVFFETAQTNRATLTRKIERHLEDALGFEVTALLRTVGEVEELLRIQPFTTVSKTPDTRLFVIFLSRALPKTVEFPLSSPKNDFDLVRATEGEVFAVARIVNGRPGNPGAFIEKTFGIRTTSRFFGTTAKILAAARKGA